LGRVTPKYKALRQLFIDTLHVDPPAIPADPKVIEIPAFQIVDHQSLLGRLPDSGVKLGDVVTMEDLDQSYGLVLYRKQFPAGVKGILDLGKALDYSIVLLDGKVVGQAFQGYGRDSFKIKVDAPADATLDILVYNLGRNSVGINQSISRKGLNENPTLDGEELKGWEIFSLPMNDPATMPVSKHAPDDKQPCIYTGTFTLSETGETYLDMRNWHFGAVWVNGHNLGRYWDVGADRGLYLPSVWEKEGENEIEVMELGPAPKAPEIKGVTNMVVEPATNFAPYDYN
jgi:beta-galactosidase